MLPIYTGAVDEKLHGLSSDQLQWLKTCQECAASVANQYCGAYHHRPEKIRQLMAEGNSTNLKRAGSLLREIDEARKRFHWWEKNKLELDKEKKWKEFFQIVLSKHRARLEEMQHNWQSDSEFAHYSSDALNALAFKILLPYEKYINELEKEYLYKRKKINPTVHKDLHDFLDKAKKYLQQMKPAIAVGMLAKLRAASNGNDITYDDVVHGTLTHLEECHVIIKDKLKEPSRNLTPEYFTEFHRYILTHIPKKQILMRYHLEWLKTDRDYEVRVHVDQFLIIPRMMLHFIPEQGKPRFWHTWFNKINMMEYLKTHYYTIAQSRIIKNRKIDCSDVAFKKHYKEWSSYSDQLIHNLKNLNENKPKGIYRILQYPRLKQIKTCENYWKQQCMQLADVYLKSIEQQLDTWTGSSIIENIIEFDEAHIDAMKLLMTDLQTYIHHNYLNSDQIYKFNQLVRKYMDKYRNYVERPRQMQLYIDELSCGIIIGNGHLKPFYDYIDELKSLKPHAWLLFQKKCLAAVDGILPLHTQILKKFSEASSSLTEEEGAILSRTLFCLVKIDDEETKKVLQQELKKLYLKYLTHLKQNKICEDWYQSSENILLLEAKELKLVEIENDCKMLQQLRVNDDENLKSTVEKLYQKITYVDLKKECYALVQERKKLCWDVIKKLVEDHEETLIFFQNCLNRAKHQGFISVAELDLESHEKTLLGLDTKNRTPISLLDKWLHLHINEESINTSDEDELMCFKENLQSSQNIKTIQAIGFITKQKNQEHQDEKKSFRLFHFKNS